jgi:hypothetical protein
MHELAASYGKAIAYLTKALGLSELTEYHSDELIPTTESFAVTFSTGSTNCASKSGSRYDLHDLGE